MKKVILVHPGTQHSFKVATALKNAGILYKFVTTVYDKESSIMMKIVKKILNNNNLDRANRRKCSSLSDNDVVQFCEFFSFITLILIRIDKSLVVYNWWSQLISNLFQRKTARYIIKYKSEIIAVIGYDMASYTLFDILRHKAPEIIRITDNAHSSRYYLHDVYKDIDSGPFKKTYINEGGGFLKSKKVANYYKEELLRAQYHIVASSFSKKAAMYSGIPESKIFLCPYGVKHFNFDTTKKDYNGDLKVLFVGEVNQRKGIYQVLEAAKNINNEHISFHIVGRGGNICAELYEPYKPYATFYGHVSYDKLVELYQTCHVFVFPTLGEGYGLVILEALSAGIPVLCSNNCAGEDIISNGYNGFIVEAGDKIMLEKKIRWFDIHRNELKEMSKNAIASVKDLTWENYNEKLVKIVNRIISIESK